MKSPNGTARRTPLLATLTPAARLETERTCMRERSAPRHAPAVPPGRQLALLASYGSRRPERESQTAAEPAAAPIEGSPRLPACRAPSARPSSGPSFGCVPGLPPVSVVSVHRAGCGQPLAVAGAAARPLARLARRDGGHLAQWRTLVRTEPAHRTAPPAGRAVSVRRPPRSAAEPAWPACRVGTLAPGAAISATRHQCMPGGSNRWPRLSRAPAPAPASVPS